MKRLTLHTIIAAVCVLTVFVPIANSQTSIDYEKMDKDLKIMEKVIETILTDRDVRLHFRVRSPKGVYLDNYGVIFMLPMTGSSSFIFRGDKVETARTSYESMREELEDFLYSYSGLIKQLDDDDLITLVANIPVSSNVLAAFSSNAYVIYGGVRRTRELQETFEASPFIMSVKKGDVNRAQNLEQFKDFVNFTPLLSKDDPYVTPEMADDLRIMNSIIKAALANKFGSSINSNSLQGTYLKDYGVLFTITTGIRIYMPELVNVVVKSTVEATAQRILELKLNELEKQIITAQAIDLENVKESEVERTKRNQEYIKDVIATVTEVIGDYAHTLKEMEPDENVTILFSSSSGYWGRSRGPVNLMFNAKFRDILAYSQGSINLETFKSRISTRTYE